MICACLRLISAPRQDSGTVGTFFCYTIHSATCSPIFRTKAHFPGVLTHFSKLWHSSRSSSSKKIDPPGSVLIFWSVWVIPHTHSQCNQCNQCAASSLTCTIRLWVRSFMLCTTILLCCNLCTGNAVQPWWSVPQCHLAAHNRMGRCLIMEIWRSRFWGVSSRGAWPDWKVSKLKKSLNWKSLHNNLTYLGVVRKLSARRRGGVGEAQKFADNLRTKLFRRLRRRKFFRSQGCDRRKLALFLTFFCHLNVYRKKIFSCGGLFFSF